MLLSVVITTKNEGGNIENCLGAFSSFREEVELIVVDNASTDDTKAKAEAFGAKVLDIGPERSAQRNLGWRSAISPWVMILDADMILPRETIEEMLGKVRALTRDGGDISAFWIPEVRVGNTWRVKARNFERSFYDGTAIDALRLFRKSVLEKTGGYDETLIAGAEDWELDIRVLALGVKAEVLRGALLHNESKLSFARMLEKKAYYSKSMTAYRAKWAAHPNVKKQFSLYYRYLGVFVENGKWRKIIAHPILFAQVMLERIAVGMVYLLNK